MDFIGGAFVTCFAIQVGYWLGVKEKTQPWMLFTGVIIGKLIVEGVQRLFS